MNKSQLRIENVRWVGECEVGLYDCPIEQVNNTILHNECAEEIKEWKNRVRFKLKFIGDRFGRLLLLLGKNNKNHAYNITETEIKDISKLLYDLGVINTTESSTLYMVLNEEFTSYIRYEGLCYHFGCRNSLGYGQHHLYTTRIRQNKEMFVWGANTREPIDFKLLGPPKCGVINNDCLKWWLSKTGELSHEITRKIVMMN